MTRPRFSETTIVSLTRDGRAFAILRGEDERPATRLELVQGWAASIEAP